MLLQRHVGGVRAEIVACEAKLRLVAEVLEQWQGCQQLWRSLTTLLRQPADCSLARQLPAEMARFRTADPSPNTLTLTLTLTP